MSPFPRKREHQEAAGRARGLAHGTAWMMLAQGGGLVFQVIYFVLITRILGVHGFGALAASLALVSIFVPFAGWGSANIIVMDVVREPATFAVSYGNALLAAALSTVLLVPLTLGLGAAFLPKVPLTAILFLGLAELGFGRVVGIGAPAFQAFERLGSMTFTTLLAPALRCLGVVVFAAAWHSHGVVTWAAVYLVGTALGAGISFWLVVRAFGRPALRPSALRSRWKLGGYFAIAASASTIYSDIDKTMLGRLSTLDATGIYAAADRAVNMAFMPVVALLAAAYPRFFRAGTSGIEGSTAYARRLLPPVAAYGLVAGVAIWFLAPIAPHILGADFQRSVNALRWLAPMPLLSALYYLPADALTGANAQGLRTVLQLMAAAINVGLNLVLIPAYSWRGAAWSTLASLGFLAVSTWLVATLMARSSAASRPSLGSVG